MASRFWQEESSSEEEQTSDNESIEERQPAGRLQERRFAAAFIDDSDSESDDEVRVVRSQKDRTFDSINETINRLKNAKKNNDWPLIQDEFGNVNKQVEKSKTLISQHGMPPAYIRMLAELEDFVLAALKDKESIKKMKAVVSKALNQMKLQIKKHNESYKTEIADFRANPDKYNEAEAEEESSSSDNGDSDDSDSDSDSEPKQAAPSKAAPSKAAPSKGKAESDSEQSDDSDEDSLFERDADSESDSDSDDSEDDEGRPQLTGRARWLKQVPVAGKDKAQVKKAAPAQPRVAAVAAAAQTATQQSLVQPAWSTVDTMTEEDLDKKVKEILAARGKKTGSEVKEHVRQLEVLGKAARRHGVRREVPLLMHLLSFRFETLRGMDDFFEAQTWQSTARSLARILALLEEHPSLALSALGGDEGADEASAAGSSSQEVLRVVGSLESFLQRLGDELHKALQQTNPHTSEYLGRLGDEAVLVELLVRGINYLSTRDVRGTTALVLRLLELLYAKHAAQAVAVQQQHAFALRWGRSAGEDALHPACRSKTLAAASSSSAALSSALRHPASFLGAPTVPAPQGKERELRFLPRALSASVLSAADLHSAAATSSEEDEAVYSALLQALGRFVFAHTELNADKTRALLFLVYHHALHGRFFAARDLFLLAHVPDFVDKAEVRMQILYNRTLVQLGIAAFRAGLYQKAHELLAPICTNPRWKELLAQGTMRVNNANDPAAAQLRDPAAEREERRRLVPYHLHVNPDLLEAVHLVSAMLLELPQLARLGASSAQSASLLAQPGVVSRWLRKYLQQSRRSAFVGPPETVREHILATTEAVLGGRFEEAQTHLLSGLEVWQFLPGRGTAERVRAALRLRLQEESARVLLLQAGELYESLSLPQVVAQLSPAGAEQAQWTSLVQKVACKMVFQREVQASFLAADRAVLVFHTSSAASSSAAAAAQASAAAEKCASLQESSERVLDHVAGGLYGFKDDWAHGKDGAAPAGRRFHHGGGRGGGRGGAGGRGLPVVPRSHGSRGAGRGGGRGGGKKSAWGGGASSAVAAK